MKVYDWRKIINELKPSEREKYAKSLAKLMEWETFRNEFDGFGLKTLAYLLHSD